MSTASLENTFGLLPEAAVAPKRPDLLSTIRLVLEAMREGHVATARYQELTRRGVAPDKAVQQVFAEIYMAG
jgi:hypothetical protein